MRNRIIKVSSRASNFEYDCTRSRCNLHSKLVGWWKTICACNWLLRSLSVDRGMLIGYTSEEAPTSARISVQLPPYMYLINLQQHI